jgi:tetratricopeptide (TPR) repeat protein
MKPFYFLGTLGVSLLVLTGCTTTEPDYTNSLTGTSVPVRDKVLFDYKNGLAAMRQGNYAEAKQLLDDAILSIGGILTEDKSGRKARSYFSGESKKNFIGEPYERVMAYYYRGILYWMDGEPDNARACFRSAQLADSDTENKEYSSDYVLLDYLDGFATTKLSGDGSDALKRAQKVTKFGVPPSYNPKANVLVFIEYGQGPLKYATGQYREELRFRNEPSTARAAVIKVASTSAAVGPYDDLYFQATTRGGRVMDHILANKAVFKSGADSFGDAALISGAVLGSQQGRKSNMDEIGLGLAAAGVLSKILSGVTTPAADTRAWDTLPQYLSFAALELSPGQHVATVLFTDAGGNALPNLTKSITINVPADGREKIVFVSDKSSTPQTL